MKKINTPLFHFIKCEWNHRLGNIISSILQILDSLITVITLGFVYSNFNWKWVFFRLSKKGKFFYGSLNKFMKI